jgi:hypothetical protein
MARVAPVVVLVIALMPMAWGAVDSLTYVGETYSTGIDTGITSPYTQHTTYWDYCYDLSVTGTTNYVWAIEAPYDPGSNIWKSSNAGAWTWVWDQKVTTGDTYYGYGNVSSLLGKSVMVAYKSATVATGTYRFQFWSTAPPMHMPFAGKVGTGTRWSNPEPGTIGMACIVLGLAGLLRKRRK